jgi:hypothetical protein
VRLCFNPKGFLFNEFEKIFSDIFGRKGKTFEKMVRACLEKKLSPSDLAAHLNIKPNSEFSEHLRNLELSGFLGRDFYYLSSGVRSKLGHVRVKDNYLRFYLKYIEPMKDKIESGAKSIYSLSELKQFDSILGLQFENLILANRQRLHEILGISPSDIQSSAPHVQRKKAKTKAGCQIDLLIHTALDIFYLCEFKCKKVIDRAVIDEVRYKMNVLALPRRSALKPVLVYEGEILGSHAEEIEHFFYRIVHFDEFLKS